MTTHHFDVPQALVDEYGGSTFTIAPLHLSVTHTYANGVSENLHVLENHDLIVGKNAARIAQSADRGTVMVAMGVDEDHDEVHYETETNSDAQEVLNRAIEVLTLALAAVEGAVTQ